MTVPHQIAFGRRPHNPARFATVPTHVAAEAPPPAELPREDLVWTPSFVHNDVAPTCCIAALLNSARIWALLRGFDLTSVDQALLALQTARQGIATNQQKNASIAATTMRQVLPKTISSPS